MCEFCDDFKFLKSIYDKRFRLLVRIITKSGGGTGEHGTYKINYCPMCRQKVTKPHEKCVKHT